jgi:hypothetical protein
LRFFLQHIVATLTQDIHDLRLLTLTPLMYLGWGAALLERYENL